MLALLAALSPALLTPATTVLAATHPAFLNFAQEPVQEEPIVQENTPEEPIVQDNLLDAARAKLEAATLQLRELGQKDQARATCDQAAALLVPILQKSSPPVGAQTLGTSILALLSETYAGRTEPVGKTRSLTKLKMLLGSQPELQIVDDKGNLDGQIYDALQNGNAKFLDQLGTVAVPGLIRILEEGKQPYYNAASHDPLTWAMRLAPAEADQFVGKLMQQGPLNVFFLLRLVRAIDEGGLFRNPLAWKTQTTLRDETRVPNITSICEQLLQDKDPSLRESIEGVLTPFADRRSFTPAMKLHLQRPLESGSPISTALRRWIVQGIPHKEIRGLLVSGLASKNDAVAKACQFALTSSPGNEGIYAAVLKAQAKVRAQGMEWIGERGIAILSDADGYERIESGVWKPDFGPEDAAFVEALLRDPEESVRRAVLESLANIDALAVQSEVPGLRQYGVEPWFHEYYPLAHEVSTGTLMALARDTSQGVREVLCVIANRLPWDQRKAITAQLAVDEDPRIRDLARASLIDHAWYQHTSTCVEIMRSSLELETGTQALVNFLTSGSSRICFDLGTRTPEGFAALIRWALESESQELLHRALHGNKAVRGQVVELPVDVWTQAVIAYADLQHPDAGQEVLLGHVLNRGVQVVKSRTDAAAQNSVLQSLLSDGPHRPWTQAVLLNAIPLSGDSRTALALTRWLEDPDSLTLLKKLGGNNSPHGRDLLRRFPQGYWIQVSNSLINRFDPDSRYLSDLFGELDSELPISPEIAARVVAEPRYNSGQAIIPCRVARWMAANPEHVNREWITGLVDIPECTYTAFNAIGDLRDPELLPVLAKVIEGPPSRKHYDEAIYALSGFLSDESARLLLIAARKTNSQDRRNWCLNQVEKIAALQDAEQRWAERKLDQSSHKAATAKLIELLDSPEQSVRIGAIRALGTLGATEALPHLVEMLSSTEVNTVQAVHDALDRINGEKGD